MQSSQKRLKKLHSKWKKVLAGGCSGCNKRRKAIYKVLGFPNKNVALLFSGGLDSVYSAHMLKMQGYYVTLYHVHWTYDNPKYNVGEIRAARDIAKMLDLPFKVFGKVQGPHSGTKPADWPATQVMRVPTMGSMLICHRTLSGYGHVAYGLHPSNDGRDQHWSELLQFLCDHCMPGATMLYPSDGKTRMEMARALPENIRKALYSCHWAGEQGYCDDELCDKCTEDREWRGK